MSSPPGTFPKFQVSIRWKLSQVIKITHSRHPRKHQRACRQDACCLLFDCIGFQSRCCRSAPHSSSAGVALQLLYVQRHRWLVACDSFPPPHVNTIIKSHGAKWNCYRYDAISILRKSGINFNRTKVDFPRRSSRLRINQFNQSQSGIVIVSLANAHAVGNGGGT